MLAARDLLGALALLVVGRTVLSWLPPGAAGSHRVRELALTFALSLVLGITAAVVPAIWLERCGVRDGWPLAVLWTALVLVRCWLRPYGFVPRRTWHERESLASKTALIAVVAACAWPMVRSWIETRELQDSVLRCASLAALAAIVSDALAQARRAPLARRLVVLMLLMTPALQRNVDALGLVAVVAAAIGVSFLVGWLRRGDERAAVLSAIGFATLAWFSNAASISGLVVLVLATHPNARRRVAVVSVVALLVIGLALHTGLGRTLGFGLWDEPARVPSSDATQITETSLLRAAVNWRVWGCMWVAAGVALAAFMCGVRGGMRETATERPGRELVAIVVASIATLVLHALAQAIDLQHLRELRPLDLEQELALLLPAAALIVGLVLAPSENSSESR